MEEIAEVIETLENLVAAMVLDMPDSIHMVALRESLPELTEKLKAAYISAGGEDYWAV